MEQRPRRTALITGGTGGLGSAVTRRFLADGWRTVVPWRTSSEPDRVGPHDELELVEADLFDLESAQDCVRRAAAQSQAPLSAVVNLVGGFASGGRVHETPAADFEEQLRLNLRPTYLVTAAALPHLLAADGGSVVCVSSRAAVRPFSGAAGYITAKAAVLAFVDALAVEYGRDGIRANALIPNVIDTPANRASQPAADTSKWVTPDQVADVILFLCGDGATALNGAHLPV